MTEDPQESAYTPDDLAILSAGAWNPGETAPDNPWADAEVAEEYAAEQAKPLAKEAPQSDIISRVELLPGGVKSAIEAILAVADAPVSVRELSAALIVSENAVEKALDELYEEYQGYDDGQTVHEPRGFELRRISGGWRLFSRADFSPWVKRFVVGETTAKLPKAVMETLTVIAYQQPATRSYVSSVRGVNVDGAFRTLLKRGLIAETIPEAETGAHQFITTPLFLEKLGMDSLDELPALAPFLPDLDDIQLATENP